VSKSDTFSHAKAVLRAADRADESIRRHLKRKCDWDDSVDRLEYRRSVRFERREEILARLVPTRVCPCCRKVRASSRLWVITKAEDMAACRTCFHGGLSEADRKAGGYEDVKLFGEMQPRYQVNGEEIGALREKAGLSLRAFARRVGWSASYQQTIERGSAHTIGLETAECIIQLFEELGILTADSL